MPRLIKFSASRSRFKRTPTQRSGWLKTVHPGDLNLPDTFDTQLQGSGSLSSSRLFVQKKGSVVEDVLIFFDPLTLLSLFDSTWNFQKTPQQCGILMDSMGLPPPQLLSAMAMASRFAAVRTGRCVLLVQVRLPLNSGSNCTHRQYTSICHTLW